MSGLPPDDSNDGLDDDYDPLTQGAAAPPPVIGGGCLARFDPDTLSDMSGVEFFQEDDVL